MYNTADLDNSLYILGLFTTKQCSIITTFPMKLFITRPARIIHYDTITVVLHYDPIPDYSAGDNAGRPAQGGGGGGTPVCCRREEALPGTWPLLEGRGAGHGREGSQGRMDGSQGELEGKGGGMKRREYRRAGGRKGKWKNMEWERTLEPRSEARTNQWTKTTRMEDREKNPNDWRRCGALGEVLWEGNRYLTSCTLLLFVQHSSSTLQNIYYPIRGGRRRSQSCIGGGGVPTRWPAPLELSKHFKQWHLTPRVRPAPTDGVITDPHSLYCPTHPTWENWRFRTKQ